MRRFLLLTTLTFASPALADGPTALTLQQQFSSGPSPGAAGAVRAAGGDTSATVATVNAPGAIARRWADRLADRLNVRDFGAQANAASAALGQAVPAGSTVLPLAGPAAPVAGQAAIGAFLSAGTKVASVSVSGGIVLVTLSAPTQASAAAGAPLDFATHDDTAAFSAALAAAVAPAQIVVPPGRYWLTGYPGNKLGVTWISQGASFTQNGGIAEQIDQSIMQQPGGAGFEIVKRMTSVAGEEGLFMPIDAEPSGTTASFQKNALHAVLYQNDPSLYAFRGDATTATHDLVGVSVQAHCPASNQRCSLFGSNWVNFLDTGSDGPSTANETQIIDNRAAGVPEMDSWNNVGAVDYIVTGMSPATNVMMIQGTSAAGPGAYDGIVFRSGAIGRRLLVERTAGAPDSTGVVRSHTDTLWLSADGSMFGQTLHVGGGIASNDALPSAGLSVDGNGNVVAPSVATSSLSVSGGASLGALAVAGPLQSGGGIVSTQSGAYALAQSDCGTTIRDIGAGPHTYLVPAGLQTGCAIAVIQAGAGVISFAAGSGETLEAFNGQVRTGGAFARASLLVDSPASAVLSGQLQ